MQQPHTTLPLKHSAETYEHSNRVMLCEQAKLQRCKHSIMGKLAQSEFLF